MFDQHTETYKVIKDSLMITRLKYTNITLDCYEKDCCDPLNYFNQPKLSQIEISLKNCMDI